jgi:hypothetical protein
VGSVLKQLSSNTDSAEQISDLERNLDYANLRVKAAEERANEAWALVKSYQESNDKVTGGCGLICRSHTNPVFPRTWICRGR